MLEFKWGFGGNFQLNQSPSRSVFWKGCMQLKLIKPSSIKDPRHVQARGWLSLCFVVL